MDLTVLLPHVAGLRLARHEAFDDELILELVPTAPSACCPDCRHPSRHIHSRYTRRITDHPLGGRPLTLHLQVRRFVCRAPTCPRRTFAEQTPTLVARYARRSTPLQADLQDIGLTLGGRPGERFAGRRAIAVSRTTLLRRVRGLPEPDRPIPRVLGIDEFALRRGQTYACLLVDLETHQPVDVLPEKSAAAVAAWLAAHRGVEVICRDRCPVFADGARRGAPDAMQVADRFHIVRNLGEAVEPVLARHHACLRDDGHLAGEAVPTEPLDGPVPSAAAPPAAAPPTAAPPAPAVRPPQPTSRQQARHGAVQELVARGLSHSQIARTLKVDRKTVRRYARAETATELASPRRPRRSRLDPFTDYLAKRWQAGCHNATRLYQELRERGYRGSRSTVRAYLAPWRAGAAVAPGQPLITVRRLKRLLLRRPTDRTAEEQAVLERVLDRDEELTVLGQLVGAFMTVLRERRGGELAQWVEAVVASGIAELVAFAKGLEADWAAVVAGLTVPWSSGQVEGQVNRVKLLKRHGYGRARFALLRKRILLAG
jgi:transposase